MRKITSSFEPGVRPLEKIAPMFKLGAGLDEENYFNAERQNPALRASSGNVRENNSASLSVYGHFQPEDRRLACLRR